jgi:formimidoylglutamate deiminase
MTSWLADLAWVDGAVRERVGLDIGADGCLAAVTPGAGEGQRIEGLVVPGLANLHSHALQRAWMGLAGPAGGRVEGMRRLLEAATPDDLQAIAAQLYAECLLHGYSSVAAFHALHNAPDGRPYDDPAEMALRLVAAAEQAGIGLRLLPVLHRHSGFGGAPPAPGERRFILPVEAYGRLCQDLAEYVPVGVAAHALRTVTPDELQAALVIADLLGPATPVHIQIAAQAREVADCLAWSGCRPVQWLLANAPVDARWCLVHATHADPTECAALAATGAVAGLCQSSEAGCGAGIFPLPSYLRHGGRFGIGSDANRSTSPVEELRWLDYVQRLVAQQRRVLPSSSGGSAGAWLLGQAAAGGAQALGRPAGAVAPGLLADLVVLDPLHPSLVGRSGDGLLDAWVFAGSATPVRHVMVAGRWVVQHGVHVRGAEIAAAFSRTMRRLGGCFKQGQGSALDPPRAERPLEPIT